MRTFENVDFVDLGCDFGSTIDFGRGVFNGGSVVGIDVRDEGRKEVIESKGNSVFVHGDALEEIESDSVRFITGGHFLEHLSGFYEASIAVNNAMKAATDFAFFNNPDFQDCSELHKLGYKYYFAEMNDHTYHITRDDMVHLAKSTGFPFCIFSSHRVVNSNDTDLWPIDVGSCGRIFDGSVEKKKMVFDKPFFKIVSMVIWKRMSDVLESYLQNALKNEVLFYDGRL